MLKIFKPYIISDRLSETLDNLSPHAAAAYGMMKKGLTLTQIYTEYASVSEQLLIKTHENEQLQNTFKAFIEVGAVYIHFFSVVKISVFW